MAKSKAVKAYEKAVVDGYTKIEDAFVDRHLTKDGETVEAAKTKLKNENTARTEASKQQIKKQ